jgi:hypothetical protein
MPTNQMAGGALVTQIPITDCATAAHPAQTWQVGVSGDSIGTGAALNGSEIDWTQSYAAVPAGYKMQYWSCGDVVWEVRWHVRQLTTLTKIVIVSARQSGTANANVKTGFLFAPPVTLRTISGP